jgi:formate/nitrite transporter FocA (FNT family)
MDGEQPRRDVPGVLGARDAAEDEAVEEATSLSARLVFEVVLREGEEELTRPTTSLVHSGLAAGILISFSVLGEAVLRAHLPEASWTPLVESLGYSFGFLLVILGRMQLLTENTITTVLPLMSQPSLGRLGQVARLWGIVLAANVAGAFIAAGWIAWTPAIPPEVAETVREISREAMDHEAFVALARGVPAGVLVAALVWMLSAGERAESFWIILLFTWLIAAGGFTHVIAGSVEMAFLVVTGEMGPGVALGGFFLPVLLGNVIGGTAVFTLLAWGQVREEVKSR